MPVLTIHDTSNIWIQNVDIKHGIDTAAAPCTFGLFRAGKELSSVVCPGVYVTSSYAVQINQVRQKMSTKVVLILVLLATAFSLQRVMTPFQHPSFPLQLCSIV